MSRKYINFFNPARLGIPRLQPGEECGVTRGRERYYRGPPAPAGRGSTKKTAVKEIFNCRRN